MAKTLRHTTIERIHIQSVHLERPVTIDYYIPKTIHLGQTIPLLILNDGQMLEEMNFGNILDRYLAENPDRPLLAACIHAGDERTMEYGTTRILHYKGLGGKAAAYTRFILHEMLLHTLDKYPFINAQDVSFGGFSLGGLSALDICWNHSNLFRRVGVFSGSLWWRSKALDEGYNDDTDRIMHKLIRDGDHHPDLTFYFQCGTLDETADRNNNGVIDSIDDTLDLITELEKKGYRQPEDIVYVEIAGGKHDGETWAQCLPDFLQWGWG